MEKTYGEIAYTAYREHTHHKSVVTGLDIPPWGSLAEEVQAAWEAAGEAVARMPRMQPAEEDAGCMADFDAAEDEKEKGLIMGDNLNLLVKQRANAWLAGEAARVSFSAHCGVSHMPPAPLVLPKDGRLEARVKVYAPCRVADFWAWDTSGATTIRTIRCERAGRGETAWHIVVDAPTSVFSKGSPSWSRGSEQDLGDLGLIREGDEIVVEVGFTRTGEWAGVFLCTTAKKGSQP